MTRDLIKKYGAAAIAKRMNETVQTVQNWIARGVPLDKALAFCDAVNFEITPHQLYPKNYPHPQDGLPAHLREVA